MGGPILPIVPRQRFGSWTVIRELPKGKRAHRLAEVRCDCGKEGIRPISDLKNRRTIRCRSCAAKTHNLTATRTYRAWQSMRARCLNKSHPAYKDYGGRGITICNRWQRFEYFLKDMGECPPNSSLDRKNNDKGYTPNNCRWATKAQQSNNRRNCKHITYKGETRTISEWSKILGINYSTLYTRLRKGWPVQKALTI